MKKKLLFIIFILISTKTYTQNTTALYWEKEYYETIKDIRLRYIDSIAIYIAISPKYVNIQKDTNNINILIHLLTNHCNNDLEKYRSIYVWQMKHTNYDFNHLNKDYDWSKNNDVYKIFTTNSGVCGGRSQLYKFLCERANLFCEVASSPNIYNTPKNHIGHAWTIIKYKNKYYMNENCLYETKNGNDIYINGFLFNPFGYTWAFYYRTMWDFSEKDKFLKNQIYNITYTHQHIIKNTQEIKNIKKITIPSREEMDNTKFIITHINTIIKREKKRT